MSIFDRFNEMREQLDITNESEAGKILAFAENNYIKYDEAQEKLFYKMPFDQLENNSEFSTVFREVHYDLLCTGHHYETGMKMGNTLKPYILVFYNDRKDKGECIEFIDRENKVKTDQVEMVFVIGEKDNGKTYVEDIGVYYNGKIIELSKINIICQFYNMRHESTVSTNVFYDEKKVTFSTIKLCRVATRNGLITKNINKRVVMNLETGKTYKLNEFDLITKKKVNLKKEPFRCLSSWLLRQTSFGVDVSEKDYHEIGAMIQNAVDKDAIPFEKYAKDSNIENPHDRLRVLVAYNTNPYVPFSVLENMYMIKDDARFEKNNYNRCFNRKFKCKVLRNKNVTDDMIKFLTTEGYNKKFINLKLNGTNLHSFPIDRRNYEDILKMTEIKDKNNKWKIVEAYFKNNYSIHTIQNFFETSIYKELVDAHKENNVINAIVKIRDSYELSNMARSYEYIKNIMPNYTLPKRLRIKEIYDTIEKDYRKLKDNAFRYHYNQETQKLLNKTVGDYKFTLATTSEELVDVGSKMSICVGGYTNNVARKYCLIVYVTKNNKYVGCIEIKPEGYIVQAKAQQNNYFEGELLNAFTKYAELTNLDTSNCYDLNNEDKVIRRNAMQFKLEDIGVTVRIPKVINNEIGFVEKDYQEYLKEQKHDFEF